MGLMGLIDEGWRAFKRLLRKLMSYPVDFLKKILGKEEPAERLEIPTRWQRRNAAQQPGLGARGSSRKGSSLVVKNGKTYIVKDGAAKRVLRIPWLRNFKRGVAGIMLVFNLAFSQFILGTENQGKILMVLFLANAFILADYLWKTRGTD